VQQHTPESVRWPGARRDRSTGEASASHRIRRREADGQLGRKHCGRRLFRTQSLGVAGL